MEAWPCVSADLDFKVIFAYNQEGIKGIETIGSGGRHSYYLTVSEERAFVAPYLNRLESGGDVTIQEVQQAFEKSVGRRVNRATVYRLFSRNGLLSQVRRHSSNA